jgi:hypothetical protein
MTTKFPSPLLGYNNNVRHKGKVFHIQTEDSGARYGHIITHLFMDGGRILKSVKTSYSEYIGNERMTDIVREMMKQQHKAMFIALRDGKFDAMADNAADASQATQAIAAEMPPAPGEAGTSPAPPPVAVPAPTGAAPLPPLPPIAAPVVVSPSRQPMPGAAYAATQPYAKAAPAAPVVAGPPAVVADDPEGPATIRQPDSELTLDIDALERAAAASNSGAPGMRHTSELPPPPANLFRDRGGMGKYRITPVPPTVAPVPPANAPRPVSNPSAPPKPGASGATANSAMPTAAARRPAQANQPAGAERRYAPTRPAAIFGQAKPQPNKSVFGEDLISDKSLDEVILSYLAEDLDEKK